MLIFFPTSVTCAKHSGFGNACTYNSDAAPPVPFVNGGTRPPGPPAMPTFSGIVCGAKTGKTCNSTTFHLTGHFQHRSNSTNRHFMRRYLFYTVTFSHTDPTLPTHMELSKPIFLLPCLVPVILTLLFLQTGAPHHAAPLGAFHVHPATSARPGRHGRRAAPCDTGAPAPHRKGMFGPIYMYSVF